MDVDIVRNPIYMPCLYNFSQQKGPGVVDILQLVSIVVETQLYDFIPLILDFKLLYIGSVFDDLWPNCSMKTYQNFTEASWHNTTGTNQIKSWANCYFL